MGEEYHNSSAFPDTPWTLVDSIYRGTEDERSASLDRICQSYWYPIYAYLRRCGRGREDAEDLTQVFFSTLISDETLRSADRERGKLRTFLLCVLKRTVCDADRFRCAQKRGSGHLNLSLDIKDAENRYLCEPAEEDDPETIYLRSWANALLDGVRTGLREEFAREKRSDLFDHLDAYISDEGHCAPYSELAAKLGSTPGAVRLLVFRLRKKFRERLRERISLTVASSEEVDSELRWMREVLGRPQQIRME